MADTASCLLNKHSLFFLIAKPLIYGGWQLQFTQLKIFDFSDLDFEQSCDNEM